MVVGGRVETASTGVSKRLVVKTRVVRLINTTNQRCWIPVSAEIELTDSIVDTNFLWHYHLFRGMYQTKVKVIIHIVTLKLNEQTILLQVEPLFRPNVH